jgi:hypothetical protein
VFMRIDGDSHGSPPLACGGQAHRCERTADGWGSQGESEDRAASAERLGPRGAGEHGRQGDKGTKRQEEGGTHPSMKGEGDGTAAGSTERLAPSA